MLQTAAQICRRCKVVVHSPLIRQVITNSTFTMQALDQRGCRVFNCWMSGRGGETSPIHVTRLVVDAYMTHATKLSTLGRV